MSFEDEREPLAAQPQQGRYREQTLLSSSLGSRASPSTLMGEEDDTKESKPLVDSIDSHGGRFECNICLDDVREPVVTQCGHLFCWSCLYRWLNTNHQTCPLCKAGVTKDNVVPLFIKGSSKDPRDRIPHDEVPNRPGANRPEVITQALGGWSMNIPNGQVNMNMGLGFFPSLFGLQFQSFAHQSSTVDGESAGSIVVTEQQQFLERILVALGSLMVICLIIW